MSPDTPTPAATPTRRYRREDRYYTHKHIVRSAILDYIGTFVDSKGYSPTTKEIRDHLVDVTNTTGQPLVSSIASISKHLQALEDFGLIERGRRLETVTNDDGEEVVREVQLHRSIRLSQDYTTGKITLRSANPD